MSTSAEHPPLDPRSIVTPEAFEISPDLLGRPLAGARRRLVAITVDGVLIVLLSQAGALLLGIAAVLFVLRLVAGRSEADRKTSRGRTRAFRTAMGCFGGTILLVTGCGLWLVLGGGPDVGRQIRSSLEGTGPAASVELGDVFGGLDEVQAYRSAETEDEAMAAATRVARRLERIGAPRPEIAEALEEMAPADAPWEDNVGAVVERAMARLDRPSAVAGPGGPVAPETGGDAATAGPGESPAAGAAPVDSLPLDEVLRRYAELLPAGSGTADPADDPAEARRLRMRLVEALAGDTLAVLERRIGEAVSERERSERRLERTRQDLQEARDAGLYAWLRRVVDDLGLAFGWGTLYMTIFLASWDGRTPGKRLLGIRVAQLDASPMTWWEAFERGGGYAAGFATGLLGFAQVLWDPNRQAIHDKICETVVLMDGADPVPGPWRARSPGA